MTERGTDPHDTPQVVLGFEGGGENKELCISRGRMRILNLLREMSRAGAHEDLCLSKINAPQPQHLPSQILISFTEYYQTQSAAALAFQNQNCHRLCLTRIKAHGLINATLCSLAGETPCFQSLAVCGYSIIRVYPGSAYT